MDRFKRQIDFRIIPEKQDKSAAKGKGQPKTAQSAKQLAALRKQRRSQRLKGVRDRDRKKKR